MPALDGSHERGGILQAVVCAGIKPCIATAELADMQIAPLQIDVIDGGDLKLTPLRGFDGRGDVDDIVVVEIKPGYGPVGFWLGRLLLDRRCPATCLVEADNAVTLGILDMVGKDGGALLPCSRLPKYLEARARRRCCRRGSSRRCPCR